MGTPQLHVCGMAANVEVVRPGLAAEDLVVVHPTALALELLCTQAHKPVLAVIFFAWLARAMEKKLLRFPGQPTSGQRREPNI